ncbi:MAG: DUF6043 family protein [Paraprevotella clara]|uniref:Uncharacterized protein n=1 Tax=Paraprevotella clara TaxID=454154 RepID=A0A6N3DS11_9BACT
MDDAIKELHHDDYPSQSEMQEWLETNREIYSDFKGKIQSVLKNPLCDNYNELIDDEMATLQSIILEIMATEEENADKIIDRFANAIKDGNVSACCLYCYLELDNGVEEIENAMTNFEQSEDAKYIKNGIRAYLEDKKREARKAVNKELNLLSLRRWHYDHPEEYQDFTNLFAKAYEGDMTFVLKGITYLTEMLSLNGIKGIAELLESLCPGTESYNKAQFASNHQQVHEKLTALFDSTFNQEATKQRLLHNNPFMCSAFYWMIFDDGFVKVADLLSKTMMDENSSVWQKGLGGQFVRSLMLASLDKAAYTKGAWKSMGKNGMAKEVVSSTLQESKGRRGRKQACVLLEEMLIQPHAELLANEIQIILTEWMETNGTDSVLAYIFAALANGGLLNDSYNYRTFHTAILEKFPSFGFKSGFDWAEALYNAIINEHDYDYNLSLSERAIQTGKEQAKLIGIRLRTLLSPDVY